MKVSTRARYGLRAMIDLAIHSSMKEPVLLKDLCSRQDLSLKYMDQIITILKLTGLVRNAGGGHSGYILSRSPVGIYASDIVNALEGGLSVRECVEDPKLCNKSKKCASRNLWRELESSIEKSLHVKLSELAEKQMKMDA
ncbi:MAG: Rrf2 family transcriptional regulator [Elusimicrobiota bacterium]